MPKTRRFASWSKKKIKSLHLLELRNRKLKKIGSYIVDNLLERDEKYNESTQCSQFILNDIRSIQDY